MSDERGFSLAELLVSTAIMLIVLLGATTAFRDALTINASGGLIADSNQNLRAAANLMVRDIMQAGRGIPTGGIPIPSGAGVDPINRPAPPGSAYTFDNVNYTTLPAIVPGASLGPTIDGKSTDIITVLMVDPTLDSLTLNATPVVSGEPTLAADGSSMSAGAANAWITDASAAVKVGDIVLFTNALGNALQTVTKVQSDGTISFESGDWFDLNQRGASQGSITQILASPVPQTTAQRVLMVTYYVDATSTPGTPRLARRVGSAAGQALAGAIEDLELTYDLVDGVNNPTAQRDLPVTIGGVLYTPNQVRKITLHVGVRSEDMSAKTHDYVRNHLTTVISVRNLAYVSRYQ